MRVSCGGDGMNGTTVVAAVSSVVLFCYQIESRACRAAQSNFYLQRD